MHNSGTRQRQLGQTVEIKSELIPTEEIECRKWVGDLFGIRWDSANDTLSGVVQLEARGKKYSRVIENYLRPIRIGIAHAMLTTGESTLMSDEALHLNRLFRWLPLAQCIARSMLKSDFPDEFLPVS